MVIKKLTLLKMFVFDASDAHKTAWKPGVSYDSMKATLKSLVDRFGLDKVVYVGMPF